MTAMAMSCRPDLIVFDEPTTSLDVTTQIEVLEAIRDIVRQFHTAAIYISHDLATARYICDRISIMYLGKFVESGPTEDILKKPAHPYTRALISAVPVPDPDVGAPDLPIKGFVNPKGQSNKNACRFSPRCPYAEPACEEAEPEATVMRGSGTEEHWAACRKVMELPEYIERSERS